MWVPAGPLSREEMANATRIFLERTRRRRQAAADGDKLARGGRSGPGGAPAPAARAGVARGTAGGFSAGSGVRAFAGAAARRRRRGGDTGAELRLRPGALGDRAAGLQR